MEDINKLIREKAQNEQKRIIGKMEMLLHSYNEENGKALAGNIKFLKNLYGLKDE